MNGILFSKLMKDLFKSFLEELPILMLDILPSDELNVDLNSSDFIGAVEESF